MKQLGGVSGQMIDKANEVNPIKPPLKKVWMVWGRVKGLPNKTIKTEEEANLAAWKLAVKNPGRSFLIMESVGVRRLGDSAPKVVDTDE